MTKTQHAQYDPITALHHLNSLIESAQRFKRRTPQMLSTITDLETGQETHGHPLDMAISSLHHMRTVVLAKYGEHMWNSADNVRRVERGKQVFKSFKAEDLVGMSDEVQPPVQDEPGTEGDS